MTKTKPILAARKAADKALDAYLERHQSTATSRVPAEVIAAAGAAFASAGGKGEIVVRGRGNTTHPVCGVTVERA